MPVSTKGSVKHISPTELETMGYECWISNSLLFSFRPGLETIEKAGGLHEFSGWNHGIFTDSGGFQILREKFFLRIGDEGVHFKNPFDQSEVLLSPEQSMIIQMRLRSDVAMCLDDVPAFNSTPFRIADSLRRTTDWAKRCLAAHSDKKQLLFGICQGGTDNKTRKKSAREIGALDFDGYAIGGLAIGEPLDFVGRMARTACAELPEEKPRYVMGVGSPLEILECIEAGTDCFDSAFPTQTGRHGWVMNKNGFASILNSKFANDSSPLDPECACDVCQSHSRAFLHHLLRNHEPSAERFLSHHNLHFMARLFDDVRAGIRDNDFARVKKQYAKCKKPGELEFKHASGVE